MSRRGQNVLTILLATVYIGQSLFLGALHYHEHDQRSHHVIHECAGHACTSNGEHAVGRKVSVAATHDHGQSSSESHSDCLICQHLTQSVITENSPHEIAADQIVSFTSTLQSCFVLLRPFSLPRPRSPPNA